MKKLNFCLSSMKFSLLFPAITFSSSVWSVITEDAPLAWGVGDIDDAIAAGVVGVGELVDVCFWNVLKMEKDLSTISFSLWLAVQKDFNSNTPMLVCFRSEVASDSSQMQKLNSILDDWVVDVILTIKSLHLNWKTFFQGSARDTKGFQFKVRLRMKEKKWKKSLLNSL